MHFCFLYVTNISIKSLQNVLFVFYYVIFFGLLSPHILLSENNRDRYSYDLWLWLQNCYDIPVIPKYLLPKGYTGNLRCYKYFISDLLLCIQFCIADLLWVQKLALKRSCGYVGRSPKRPLYSYSLMWQGFWLICIHQLLSYIWLIKSYFSSA